MSTPHPEFIWTLHDAGKELQGCHIVFDGINYQFTEQNPHNVLATTPGPFPTFRPFTFPIFTYLEQEWAITLWNLPEGRDGHGTWAAHDRRLAETNPPGKKSPITDPQSGDFTAMAGGSIDPEKASYRAKA